MDRTTARSSLKKLMKLIQETATPVGRIVVFGSHARGLARAESDLDICLIFPDKIKNAEQMAAKLRFNLGRLDINIDLSSLYESELTKNRLSSFVHEINTSGMTAADFLKRTPKLFGQAK